MCGRVLVLQALVRADVIEILETTALLKMPGRGRTSPLKRVITPRTVFSLAAVAQLSGKSVWVYAFVSIASHQNLRFYLFILFVTGEMGKSDVIVYCRLGERHRAFYSLAIFVLRLDGTSRCAHLFGPCVVTSFRNVWTELPHPRQEFGSVDVIPNPSKVGE